MEQFSKYVEKLQPTLRAADPKDYFTILTDNFYLFREFNHHPQDLIKRILYYELFSTDKVLALSKILIELLKYFDKPSTHFNHSQASEIFFNNIIRVAHQTIFDVPQPIETMTLYLESSFIYITDPIKRKELKTALIDSHNLLLLITVAANVYQHHLHNHQEAIDNGVEPQTFPLPILNNFLQKISKKFREFYKILREN